MLEWVLLFMGVSLLLYALLGGADYGAGILEFNLKKELTQDQRKIISKAIGPVWEANHIWLVLLVVILFFAFPKAYTFISIYLHLPLLLVLVGIVLRGTAFTFREYDAFPDPKTQKVYSAVFESSSFLAPFASGVVIGSICSGRLDPNAQGYMDLYVTPWLNPFCFSVGFFVLCLFCFLASVYLIGESKSKEVRDCFVKSAQKWNAYLFIVGAAVFLSALFFAPDFLERFLSSGVSAIAFLVASLLLLPLWWCLKKEKIIFSRLLVATLTAFILVGWFGALYPDFILTQSGAIAWQDVVSPAASLKQLLFALSVGLGVVIPSFIFLLWVFKA